MRKSEARNCPNPTVNDLQECNQAVALLHALAIEYNCPIIGAIHLNPNSDKTRGHLGSQLERKAESNLRLEAQKGKVLVWGDKNRHAPIPKRMGSSFCWCPVAGMHISAESATNEEDEDKTRLREMARAVFEKAASSQLTWKDFVNWSMKGTKLSVGGARKRLERMTGASVVKKNAHDYYELAP